jgi:hypothetical protein
VGGSASGAPRLRAELAGPALGDGGGTLVLRSVGAPCREMPSVHVALSGPVSTGSEGNFLWSGLLYNQWLGAALQAIGIPKSEEHRRHGSAVAGEGRGRWWARRALRHALDGEGGPQGGLHVAAPGAPLPCAGDRLPRAAREGATLSRQ